MWLYTDCKGVLRLAYTVTVCPLDSLTLMETISLFVSGSKIKFSQAFDFFENLDAGLLLAPPKEVPCPEKAIYGGGGGGTYFYLVLSDRLTERAPVGYFFLSYFGIELVLIYSLPFVQLGHELLVLGLVIVLELAIVD